MPQFETAIIEQGTRVTRLQVLEPSRRLEFDLARAISAIRIFGLQVYCWIAFAGGAQLCANKARQTFHCLVVESRT